MNQHFENVIKNLLCMPGSKAYQANLEFETEKQDLANKLNSAFLICLSGSGNPLFKGAHTFLHGKFENQKDQYLAGFYIERLKDTRNEINNLVQDDPSFTRALKELEDTLQHEPGEDKLLEDTWSVFFPEAVGVSANKDEKAEALRAKRTVKVNQPNPCPIKDPAREILFTSNVLLGIPGKNTDFDTLPYTNELKQALKNAMDEPQVHWFDHPIQVGVEPEGNEIIYGISKLDEALEAEKSRGNLNNQKVSCVLSVSVTHRGLGPIAKDYIQQELANNVKLKNLEVYVFTEEDTKALINDVLAPASGTADSEKLLEVFGVDGAYGRHYSFLKAIAAIWNTLVDKDIKATFKIDLDQVFPQEELVEQTGKSALEHFKNPLWGATATDNNGHSLELGMIAGALVNEKDIHAGIFTPDVPFPDAKPDSEGRFFNSKLLMALSTRGELMTRYKPQSEMDGENTCIQRIHVTGGTNGIMIDSLVKHRPFTPSFIGRAEDQCYILSVLDKQEGRLAYYHEDGLIMRHDKEAFAQDAMKAAKFGNIIGDYLRIIFFSAYAKIISRDVDKLKEIADPFTGCFISKLPITVCMMRFCMKGASFFESGDSGLGNRFFYENAPRLQKAIDFVYDKNGAFEKQILLEREGWNLFYDILEDMKSDPGKADKFKTPAKAIVDSCRVVN